MPNWCNTSIHFESKDITAITDFHNRLSKVRSEKVDRPSTSFQGGWLGDIAKEFLPEKYHYNEKTGEAKIRLRGKVDNLSDLEDDGDKKEFIVTTETAWEPMINIWFLINKLVYKGKFDISFVAEEPGMEIYQKYGDYYDSDSFHIEGQLGDYVSEYFDTVEGIKSWILDELSELGLVRSDLEGISVQEVEEKFDKAAKEKDPRNWVSIHEFQYLNEKDLGLEDDGEQEM